MSSRPTYYLYSTERDFNVGIWYLTAQEEPSEAGAPSGQPVRLNVDLVEWVASRPVAAGGPTKLSVGPYIYTFDYKGMVYATNDERWSQDWFIIPGNQKDTYLIAADPRANFVWTAKEEREPILVKPFVPGDHNQVFKFVPRLTE